MREQGSGEMGVPGWGGPYPAIQGQQDGVALDVPVYDALGVQVRQGLQHGLAHSGDLLLVQPGQGRQGHRRERMLVLAGLQDRWAGSPWYQAPQPLGLVCGSPDLAEMGLGLGWTPPALPPP